MHAFRDLKFIRKITLFDIVQNLDEYSHSTKIFNSKICKKSMSHRRYEKNHFEMLLNPKIAKNLNTMCSVVYILLGIYFFPKTRFLIEIFGGHISTFA